MPIVNSLKQYLANRVIRSVKETEPETAYDIWSVDYDQQPDNLMLVLDEQIFTTLSSQVPIAGKILADIGCGTGRHWKYLLSQNPVSLAGYDVSKGMLNKLIEKFPEAKTYRLENDLLPDIESSSLDLLISTLTVAHIDNIKAALAEWDRVVKPGGYLIITDYHPTALSKGGKRTFKQGQTLFAVKNYIHTLQHIKEIIDELDLELIRLLEKRIDDSMLPYYAKQGAEKIFENF
jgi:ubiquinone/menaquinone biosynthesis C-methylase UbiE